MDEQKEPALLRRLREGRAREIREARAASGLTQAQVAELAGTTQQTVDRIERGATEHSRAYSAVRSAVGLPPEDGFNSERIKSRLAELDRRSKEFNDEFALRYKQEHSDEMGIMPVYGLTIEDSNHWMMMKPIDFIPRNFPVERVKDAYAVMISDIEMRPVFRPGDIVIVNPHIPPSEKSDVLLRRPIGDIQPVMIRTLVENLGDEWAVQTWTPTAIERVSKADWPRAELIVGRLSFQR